MSQTIAGTKWNRSWRWIICIWVVSSSLSALSADTVSFRSEIAPILLENCVACHGAKKAEGGYRLDTFAEMMKTGDSGVAPVTAGDGEKTSELLRRLTLQAP